MNSKLTKWTFFDYLNILILFVVVVVTLYPFLYLLAASLSDQTYIQQGAVGIIPKGFTLNAYKAVAEYPMIWRSYGNTFMYTISGTLLSLVLTIFGAYPLSRQKFIGKKLFMGMIVFTMLFAPGMIPTFLLVNGLNMRNTLWAIVVPMAVSSFNLIIMKSFFEQIPSALEEAAKIDGCNHFRTLFQIIVPLSVPSIMTIGLFYAVGQWNSFFPALLYLSDENLYPIQIILRNIVLQNQTENIMQDMIGDKSTISESVKYATIMFATIPILVAYPFIQKYFVSGMTIGAVKG